MRKLHIVRIDNTLDLVFVCDYLPGYGGTNVLISDTKNMIACLA